MEKLMFVRMQVNKVVMDILDQPKEKLSSFS